MLLGSACSSAATHTTSGLAASTTSLVPLAASVSAVKPPTVIGPITGGRYGMPFNPAPPSVLKQYGYSEKEYFIAGTATAYGLSGTAGGDGKWSAHPTTSAAYKTRILVRRPDDPAKFNGTVVVEWLNVTAGQDSDPDWGFAYDELMRAGFAWVGVSAQSAGVGTGGAVAKLPIPGFTPEPLRNWDPQRYGSLLQPGDQYSYDMFSQAGMAVARPGPVPPLGGLRATRLIAAGESQSASRLVTYVDAVEPVAKVYDAFLIHSRGPKGAPLSSEPSGSVPKVAFIRDDLRTPVLLTETETDLFGLGFYPARQRDTPRLVTWEMAGTSHADQDQIDYETRSNKVWNTQPGADFTQLCGRLNDGPQKYMIRKAIDALNTWARGGAAPVAGPRFVIDNGTAIARDADGNALGGVRTPQVDVPTEALTGVANPNKTIICSLFGSSTPYPPAKLEALYPTHEDYVDKVTAAANKAVAEGHLQPADRDQIVSQAKAAKVPR
jgi:hypothetical protein